MHKLPIFISGIGRSGTSAVISAMSEHSEVVKPDRVGEAPFINHFVRFLKEFEDLSPHRDYHLKNYQLSPDNRAEVFSNLMATLQYGFDVDKSDLDKRYWIAKVSFDQESYEKAAHILGELRIIYVIRNGIEVVNSARNFKGFADLSFEQLCSRWVNNITQCDYVNESNNCAVIKHHEMVENPGSVFESVFKKLSISQDKGPAEFIAKTLFNSSFDKSEKLSSTATVFSNRLECWNEWTEEEKRMFISKCDDTMDKYNFTKPYSESYKPEFQKTG